MSDTPTHPIYTPPVNPNYDIVMGLVQTFFPQYFDPNSPSYVTPDIMTQLNLLAVTSRPWCLSNAEQNLAEAWFTAYLVSLRSDTSSGVQPSNVAGPIVSEREGDIAVTYADLSKSGGAKSSATTRPPSDPYDAWSKLWARCGVGSITTRYGDPVRRMSASAYSAMVMPQAIGVWQQWP